MFHFKPAGNLDLYIVLFLLSTLEKKKLVFTITDQGKGFDFSQLPDPTAPENIEKYPASNVILDSEAAIAIASSDKDTKRTRHILQRYHFVRQGSALGQHQLGQIGTENQIADPLTKNGVLKTSTLLSLLMYLN